MRELAERAVACEGWRWMAGMQPLSIDSEGDWTPCERVARPQGDALVIPEGALPDLTDPATRGLLRHLAAVALGAFDVHIQTGIAPRMDGLQGRWRAVDSRGRLLRAGGFVAPLGGDATAHGLVAALEAAP